MDVPLVSIIIPVFNGANYMRDAIDSALAQTWPKTEIIVVNDGSTDETHEIAKSYGDRIRYIKKKNGGVASALNAGIRAMKGDVFNWLSHDDRYHPDKVVAQVHEWLLCRKPEILISNYRLINPAGEKISDIVLDHKLLTEKPLYALLRGSIHGCTVFIPKPILDEFGGFDEKLPTTQDVALWRKIIKKYPFRHLDKVLIDSRWHDEQGSKKIDHRVEARDFWVDTVADVDNATKIKLEGSAYKFDTATADFLAQNGLHEPAGIIRERAEKALSETLVSIVMPVFNRVDLAFGALDSVKRQTHPNWELIVVDDGSTQDMSKLKAAVDALGEKARYIRKENGGAGSARNRGWEVAKGKYVAFLDSDDLFLPGKLEVQLKRMEEAGAAFSQTSSYRTDGKGELTLDEAGRWNAFPNMIGGCGISTPTVMVRRDLIDQGFRFRTDIHLAEDICLWLEIGAKYGALGIVDALSVVRASGESTSNDIERLKRGADTIIQFVESNEIYLRHTQHVQILRDYRRSLDVMK